MWLRLLLLSFLVLEGHLIGIAHASDIARTISSNQPPNTQSLTQTGVSTEVDTSTAKLGDSIYHDHPNEAIPELRPYLVQGNTAIVSSTEMAGKTVVTAQILPQSTVQKLSGPKLLLSMLGMNHSSKGDDPMSHVPKDSPIQMIRALLRFLVQVVILFAIVKDYETDITLCPTEFPNYIEVGMISLASITDITITIFPNPQFKLVNMFLSLAAGFTVLLSMQKRKPGKDENSAAEVDALHVSRIPDEWLRLGTGASIFLVVITVYCFLLMIFAPKTIPFFTMFGPALMFLSGMVLTLYTIKTMIRKDRIEDRECLAKLRAIPFLYNMKSNFGSLLAFAFLVIGIMFVLSDFIAPA